MQSRLRVSDPDHSALRSAARATVVVPSAIAICQLGLGNSNTALFAGFGSLGVLVFVNFSGPRNRQLAAYSALLVAGAVLISIGTLCSRSPVLATVGMAVVGFVLVFSGVINGYIAAGTNAALLSFILAVMVPATAADIPSRLTGWAIGGVLAATATLVLFPERPRDDLRSAAADACRAIADLLAEPDQPGREDAALAAVQALRKRYVATPFRPTGSTGAGAALTSIVDELTWLSGLVAPVKAGEAESDVARATIATVLRESAQRLNGHGGTIEVDRLVELRADLMGGLIRRLEGPAVSDDGYLRDALHSTWQLQVISYATLQIGALARTAAGARQPLAVDRALGTVRRLVADHATLRSVWTRNALRATAGLSLAVLVGQLASVQHSFWIVLGTLSVLRSSVLGTGASVIRALFGTIIGIVIGGALLTAIGSNDVLAWVALPPAIFVALYAPRAISFAAGQAGFTVAVVVFFNLIAPTGWKVGLVRVEDVAIGFAISVVVALLFWPRGAAAVLRRSLGDAFEASAAYLATSASWLLEGGIDGELTEPRRDAIAREHLLDVAVRQYLAERSPPGQRVDDVTTLAAGSVRLRVTGDALAMLGHQSEGAERPPASNLRGDVDRVRAWYAALGTNVAAGAAPPVPADTVDALPRAVLEGVRETAVTGNHALMVAAVAVGWASEHLDLLGRLEDPIARSAARVAPSGP
ncbi:MAG: protein of unknown function YccS/YhfK [Actinomycetia bacterium]|nr:protein of unknown function YccS/YhfK [Actinomycetes bacterium]